MPGDANGKSRFSSPLSGAILEHPSLKQSKSGTIDEDRIGADQQYGGRFPGERKTHCQCLS